MNILNYCWICGEKLFLKYLKNEGAIPFCQKCGEYRFPIFSTAVSMIVENPEKNKILLIQQYQQKSNILVAGYINQGESAEDAVKREVKEEIGISVHEIRFNQSQYFEKSNTLMLNFSCVADTEDLSYINSEEIDQAKFYEINQAVKVIKPKSLAEKFLLAFLKK